MKKFIAQLGFTPKENTTEIFVKKFTSFDNYTIEVDFNKETIDYGKRIKSERDTTRNFSQEENWVVLECVIRLLKKGYRPEDIILEKKFTVGHGAAGGWLDILVRRDGQAYLMIECKTWGREFDREWFNTQKKGGQLLSYLQQDRSAEFLVLYASQFDGREIQYRNEIIKVEEDYRQMASNTEDLYNRWNKFSKQNGIFEPWTRAYDFQSKALSLGNLAEIRQEDSSFIFNRFLEILRHNAVSDKPNAFNKIFTLFLCKIKDEDRTDEDEEVDFQWKEGEDDSISFQKRLSDLYKKGMKDFLEKDISDLSDDDFHRKFGMAITDEKIKQEILREFTRIRLQKNNEFAIKEVFDEETFEENAKVLKEVVELLQGYRFRYAKKQPFLGDFFELLLTTGLKQEAGQFFTPVPIARFICKSIPMRAITEKKLKSGARGELLPNIIDYAAGSGHFLTESMEELQNIIQTLDTKDFPRSAGQELEDWQRHGFKWAYEYIYGIELDYRLVKTTKVGCYLHGDGIANVIHGDGLDSFTHSDSYSKKLKKTIPGTQDNGQFNFVLSNPPYSVSACKGNLKNRSADKDFVLYDALTDQSSQIESLFIERTKQLLAEGGIAAIILPSSILSNGGIYTKTREILLRYFEFVSIVELGSGTFMATGTNTVILFLRRRSNYDFESIETGIKNFFQNHKDINIKTNFTNNTVLENGISKYVSHVWGEITLDDYISLISGEPSADMQSHELYVDYLKKIKSKNPKDWLAQVITLEREKILYYILAYGQEIVLVKSGDKQDEKNFLGYEFSNRKGDEGIHPIRRGKTIDDCTLLFDPADVENPERVNSYILDAFSSRHDRPIVANLGKYISRMSLVDMLTLDRAEFEKSISLSVKKKVTYEDIWKSNKLVSLGEVAKIWKGTSITKDKIKDGTIPVIAGGQQEAYFHNESNRTGDIITISASGAYAGFVNYFTTPIFASDCNTVQSKDESIISTRLISLFLKTVQSEVYGLQRGQAQPHVYGEDLSNIKIPLPTLDVQKQIVDEMEILEQKEEKIKKMKDSDISEIQIIVKDIFDEFPQELLGNLCDSVEYGTSEKSQKSGQIPVIRMGNIKNGKVKLDDLVYTDNQNEIKKYALKYNDILFNRTNSPELVGKVGIYKSDKLALFAGYLIRINYKKDLINPILLAHILNSSRIRNYGFSVMSKSINQANINGTILKSYKIPLPPFAEQERIVKEIEEIEGEIAQLEVELASIPAQKEAILRKYL